jgi:hypothetical protein
VFRFTGHDKPDGSIQEILSDLGLNPFTTENVLQELKGTGATFTVYLRYMQKDTLAKIPNVRVREVFDDHVNLENQNGFGILGYEDILYLSIPRQ